MNEDIMQVVGFGEQLERVENGCCPICNTPICYEDFEDELSRNEYKISGLCQKCQNEYFVYDW